MLPYLQEVQNASKKYTVAFRGLNYGEGTQDGEFAETHNLSTDLYPCITQRAARVEAGKYSKPSSLHSKGKLLVIDGTKVMYGDEEVGTVTEGKKQIATVGNYIVIFPDKVYYKVPTDNESGEFGNMECTYETTNLTFSGDSIYKADFSFSAGDTIVISGCSTESNNKEAKITKATGTTLTFASGTFTEAEESGDVTLIKYGAKHEATRVRVFYSDKYECWYAKVYTGVTNSFNVEDVFKVGDVVEITGCETAENNRVATVIRIDEESNNVYFAEDGFKLTKDRSESAYEVDVTFTHRAITYTSKGLTFGTTTISRGIADFKFRPGDAVIISGCSTNGNNKDEKNAVLIKEATKEKLVFNEDTFVPAEESGLITIKRPIPPLDYICESNYRLWGTHKNTIYSSKFSDPLNFFVYENLSSDGYAIDVGTEGEFTGCIPYASHVCFFKENTLHKMYGTKPSNFQVNTVNVYGVQSGSERSMYIVNETLLYKGVGGVYAYTGGVPELISENFSTKRYSDAVASCDGEKYYISMKHNGKWNMFTYDIGRNIWLREDDTQAVDMTFYDGKVYYLDADGGLYYIDKSADQSDIEWSTTFCTIHETINERKGYSKFHLRMDLSAGAWLAVDIKTDNDQQWHQVYTTHNDKAKTVSIPIIPTRCDSIDIRLRGKGKSIIKTFIREFTVGSDV